MLNQAVLIDEVAAYKKDSRRAFDMAVASLIALAWPYRKKDFAFEPSFELYDEALVICMELSDKCAEDAEKHLLRAVSELEWEGKIEQQSADDLERLDMSGSHLLELLGVWIGVAVANNWTQSYTKIMISRYLTNPFLCPGWKDIPLDTLSWGKGYAKDIAEQIAVIGQGIILDAARRIEQEDERRKGATYYVRHRGSSYDCNTCDELANTRIPIEEPFEIPHPRCVCWPEYFYTPIDE